MPTDSKPAIRLSLSPQIIRAALPPNVSRGRLLTTFKAVLRPAKPLIVPISRPFLFTLGSLARVVRQKRSK